jgi:calcineurin-like phosphoesterase family protein
MSERNVFVISDTHFCHTNILKFKDKNGNHIRQFGSVDDMNHTMISNWNSLIEDHDLVYHLGDVSFGNHSQTHEILSQLKGRKRLIVGNHDPIKSKVLHDHFQKIFMWKPFNENGVKALLTHVPVHPSNIPEGYINVHGHIHQNNSPEGPYFNVSVEKTDYKPVKLCHLING